MYKIKPLQKITCNECQNQIDGFLRGELDEADAASFAIHVRGCENCYNELEINFCMQTAVAELQSDEKIDGDFTRRLKTVLAGAEEKYIISCKYMRRKRFFVILGFIVIGLYVGCNFY